MIAFQIRCRFLMLLAIIVLGSLSFSVKSQDNYDRKIEIFRERDLVQLKVEWKENHILIFERLIAFYFNSLINEYRLSKNLVPLYWDDNLWLAARNHNVYMSQNDMFNHSQNMTKSFSTGKRPSDRVEFVFHRFKPYQNAGYENIVAYSANGVPEPDLFFGSKVDKEKVKKQAYDIALEALRLWQSSSGHNANMLDSGHRIHSTSFIYSAGMFYGTSLFVSESKCIQTDEIEIPEMLISNADTLMRFMEKLPFIETCNKELKHTDYKYFTVLVEFFDSLELTPNKKLYNTIKNKKNISQENIKKEFLKETKYFGIFKLIGKNITLITHKINLSKRDFHMLIGMKEIEAFLNSHESKLSKSSEWAATTFVHSHEEMVSFEVKLVIIHDK